MHNYKLGKLSEAKKCFLKALKLEPNLHKASYNLGILLLREGNFKKGWFEREKKRKVESELIRDNLDSYWKGEYVNGTLYVWREQGLGEEILFSSPLLLLKNLAKKVILEVDE